MNEYSPLIAWPFIILINIVIALRDVLHRKWLLAICIMLGSTIGSFHLLNVTGFDFLKFETEYIPIKLNLLFSVYLMAIYLALNKRFYQFRLWLLLVVIPCTYSSIYIGQEFQHFIDAVHVPLTTIGILAIVILPLISALAYREATKFIESLFNNRKETIHAG